MTDLLLKALTTSEESNSNQRLDQLLVAAISMALIAPESSAWKALPVPVFSAKHKIKSAWGFLKMPPQAEILLHADPSVLHLIQKGMGGF